MIVIFVEFIDQLIDYPINRTSLSIKKKKKKKKKKKEKRKAKQSVPSP